MIIALSVTVNDARADGGEKYPRCFAGTYLVDEVNGTKSLWSLGDRGVLLVTSSTQPSLNFSNGHGACIRTGKLKASAVLIDFSFDNDGNLKNIVRVNSEIRFMDNRCEAIEGEFIMSFSENGTDPLDPDSVPENVVSDTFTGQRVMVER